jgi:hypothetical protein
MGWQCLFGHEWTGCVCDRCGKNRDRHHVWVTAECRIRCQRCGLVRGQDHDWAGCVCRSCAVERHDWADGVCQRCGEHCAHRELRESWDTQFFHRPGEVPRVCSRCGGNQPGPS